MPSTPSDPPPIPHLLASPEALESYLVDIRLRREQHRRAYWLKAAERVSAELLAAETEGASEIAAELRTVVQAFHDAIAATETPSLPEIAESEEPPAPAHDTTVTVTQEDALPPSDPEAERRAREEARKTIVEKAGTLEYAIACFLAERGDSLADTIHAHSLFCAGNALLHDPSAPLTGLGPLRNSLDDLMAGTPWADTQGGSLPLLTPQTWETLSALYDACIVAGEAIAWYEENEPFLHEHSRVELLNAIAAAQQQVYRRPEYIVRRDAAMQELYQRIRAAGQRTAYIRALGPHITDAELPDLASSCLALYNELRVEVSEGQAQAQRQARKDTAIAAVLAWEEALEGRGITSESLASDRESLCALLEECLAAGVPATNVKVRAALLDTAPMLLADQAPYAKFLASVVAERTRRGLDAVEVEPPQMEVRDEDIDPLTQSVLEFTRGRKIVMLGGKKRPQVAQELAARLDCDVNWPDSDPGDKFAKFASAVKKADVVLLLKNFASHDLFYQCKSAMAENGKHFVVLPSGYGQRQVVFQLAEYAARVKGDA